MKSIYIIRHGQTEYNRQGVLQGRAIDAPLNDTGRAQARSFFNMYGNAGFELVITSELQRSIESVQGFLRNGIAHRIDERITEFSWGANEGKALDEIILHNYKQMLRSWYQGNLDARIPGGESGRELYNRVSSFMKELAGMHQEKILICTHGRTLKMLVALMQGLEIRAMESIRHSNMALFLFRYTKESFELLRENDTAHLPKELHQSAFWDK